MGFGAPAFLQAVSFDAAHQKGVSGNMTSFEELRRNVGHDLVGVAPMSSFDGLPSNKHPRSIFPDGKSVVVVGSHIRRGEFRSMEEGSLWKTPGRWLTQLEGVVRYIESKGYECIPYAPVDAPRIPRRPVREGLCAPNSVRLSVDYAAVVAGLGEIGYHGIFMTEKFGIRQRLGLLVTDMEIEPSRTEGTNICDGCMECVKMCPLQAISMDESTEIHCNGKTMRVGVINTNACRACPNGVSSDSGYFAGGLLNRLAAACGRACIAHFEATHETGYRIPFRIREPWGFRPDQERG